MSPRHPATFTGTLTNTIATDSAETDRVCVFVDTESSVCVLRRRRVLVSIAYQVVDVHGTVYASHYELVYHCPTEYLPDPQSVAIHRISPEESQQHGQPLADVLYRFFACVGRHRPAAIVGHDIGGDLALLVSEAVNCADASPDAVVLLAMIPQRAHLVCTRMLATHHCAIPLPAHLSIAPWERLLERFTKRRHGRGGRAAAPGTHAESITYKWPSLRESYEALVRTPKRTEDADHDGPAVMTRFPMHDARGDVDRCRDVFLTLYARETREE